MIANSIGVGSAGIVVVVDSAVEAVQPDSPRSAPDNAMSVNLLILKTFNPQQGAGTSAMLE